MDQLSFNTVNFSTMASMLGRNEIKPYESKAGEFDPAKLFSKKNIDDKPLGFQPDNIKEYSQEDIQELEEYCKQRGIIGVNFGGMSPKTVLNMLRGKTGIPTEGKTSNKKMLFD